MLNFLLSDAAAWTGGALRGADGDVLTVSTDSRKIGPGCLFIPLAGEKFDGHDFIGAAIANGASAVLTHRPEETYPVPSILVEDTRQALLDLAGGYRDRFDCPVIGVTGSVGKTTTKEMIWSVLSQRFDTLKTEGNLNNTVGMPLTALRLEPTTDAAVFEMGMSHFGEIAAMAACGKPNLAVITNIGTSHIEFLGSREGICRAKMEILEGLQARRGLAILCGDEPLLWARHDNLPCRAVWFGRENEECDVRATDIVCTNEGVTFTLLWPEGETPCKINIPGIHNVTNALAAAACGWVLGLDGEEIAAGLDAFRPVGHRQKLFEQNGVTIYEDCYNASPDSMEAALAVLRDLPNGRKLAVLGGMGELGDYAIEGHRRAGRAVPGAADALYLYGENSEYIGQGAAEAGFAKEKIYRFDDHESLAAALRADARPGDALLFKGSRVMKMERALGLFLGEEV